jgi:hypothetical protein
MRAWSIWSCERSAARSVAFSIAVVGRLLRSVRVLGPAPPTASIPWADWNLPRALAVSGPK